MNLHSLKPSSGSTHRRKRLGRGHGSGLGKTAGKGHKGQMARSGHKHKPTFEGGQLRIVQRVPKRGFNNYNHVTYVPLNVGDLDRFDDGAEVTLDALKEKGLAQGPKERLVKILATGEVSKKLTVHAHKFSAAAKSKIEAAGGTCVEVK